MQGRGCTPGNIRAISALHARPSGGTDSPSSKPSRRAPAADAHEYGRASESVSMQGRGCTPGQYPRCMQGPGQSPVRRMGPPKRPSGYSCGEADVWPTKIISDQENNPAPNIIIKIIRIMDYRVVVNNIRAIKTRQPKGRLAEQSDGTYLQVPASCTPSRGSLGDGNGLLMGLAGLRKAADRDGRRLFLPS